MPFNDLLKQELIVPAFLTVLTHSTSVSFYQYFLTRNTEKKTKIFFTEGKIGNLTCTFFYFQGHRNENLLSRKLYKINYLNNEWWQNRCRKLLFVCGTWNSTKFFSKWRLVEIVNKSNNVFFNADNEDIIRFEMLLL